MCVCVESSPGHRATGDRSLKPDGNGGYYHSGPMDVKATSEEEKDKLIKKLSGTLAHYRAWVASTQARFAMYHPDVVRPARRIYVGGLPLEASGVRGHPVLPNNLLNQGSDEPNSPPSCPKIKALEIELRHYMNEKLVECSGCAAAGFPISSCKIYADKAYAFLELRSVEEASNCMAFDGIAFKDSFLRARPRMLGSWAVRGNAQRRGHLDKLIRRPNNYDVTMASLLGPTEADPSMDLEHLDIVKTVVQDTPHKLFLGGLPCDWSEDQVKELLIPHGTLKAFNLVMDKNTGNSKGYAFCEYRDVGLTDLVIQALNGKQVGSKFLTVKRAIQTPPF